MRSIVKGKQLKAKSGSLTNKKSLYRKSKIKRIRRGKRKKKR